ncbi:MAG: Gfo/Idh/MocA family oxidoreductase [Bacteroidia bacterium]
MKIGVLGAGHLGKIHIRLLKEIADWELVGFFDTDLNKAKAYSEEIGVPYFTNDDDLIAQCDAIDIVTPTKFHHYCATKCLKAGKHIFIEKPVAASIKEAKDMIKLADEANVKVQIGHVERFNPAFLAARSFIYNPMFIETHRLAQFNPRGTDVSVVLDLMIHDIDIVLSIVKSHVKKISASGVAVVSDTPDIANARIEFDNGCVCNLTASRISLKNMRKSRFFQKDAYVAVDFLKKKTEIVKMKPLEGEPDPLGVYIELGEGKGQKQIYFENPKVDETNAIKMELEFFAKSILENTIPVVSLHDGFEVLYVAHQIIDRLKNILV